jgi:methyl-accepting chemotaxis protein
MDVKLVAALSGGIEVEITAMDQAVAHRLGELLARLADNYKTLIDQAQAFAEDVTTALEEAVQNQSLTADVLFDSDYVLIPGTEPQQFNARFTQGMEKILEPILAKHLTITPAPIFCITQDRNGYVPVHNRAVSQPQRPGDVVWNTKHSRNKRIFNDRVGLACSRSIKPFLIQYYHRDMGGGIYQLIKEFNAPLFIAGRHWGTVRLAWMMEKGTAFLSNAA